LHNVKSKKINIIDLIKSEKVIVGGGGLFFGKMMRVFIALILVSKFLGKEVEIFRVGVDETKSKMNKLLIKLAFNMADKISVRDEKSKSILRSYGVSKNIDVLDDPAYSIFTYSGEPKKKSAKIDAIGISYADKIKHALRKNIKTIDLNDLSFKNLVSEFESAAN